MTVHRFTAAYYAALKLSNVCNCTPAHLFKMHWRTQLMAVWYCSREGGFEMMTQQKKKNMHHPYSLKYQSEVSTISLNRWITASVVHIKQSVLCRHLFFPHDCVHTLKLTCSQDNENSTMRAKIFINAFRYSSYLHQGSQSTGGLGLVSPVSLCVLCWRFRCVRLCWVRRLHQAVFQTGVVNNVLHVHQTVAVSGAVLHKVN